MDSSPLEQEVNVVNTFLQVTEVSKAKAYRRSQTAPVRDVLEVPQDVDEDDEDEDEEEESTAGVTEKTEKEVIEEVPTEVPTKPAVKKVLRALPTLNRIETPEPWDLAALAESLKEEEEDEETAQAEVPVVVPSLAKVIAKPGFIHSATPDMWEWEALVRQDAPPTAVAPMASAAPPVTVAPPVVTPAPASSPMPATAQVFQAQQPMVSLLPVPVTFAVPSSPPMTPPLSPSNGFVGLLGSLSPTASPIGSPKDSPTFSTMKPGTLETSTVGSKEVVKWCVDGSRFDSHQERILSPEFQIHFPGQSEAFSFRMVILATQTGGKHGAGFRKAKGRGSIEFKCQSTVPANVASVTFRTSMGVMGHHGHQVAAKPIWHNFVDKTCCPLRNGEEIDWDFKQSVAGKGCEISVEVDFQK